MNEDFVTFEIAKKLKEKGFDRPTLFRYDSDGKLPDVLDDVLTNEGNVYYRAPNIYEVLKWLMEEKKIYIEIFLYNGKYCYFIKSITQICEDDLFHKCLNEDTTEEEYDTYEQAALAGIEYTLNNII